MSEQLVDERETVEALKKVLAPDYDDVAEAGEGGKGPERTRRSTPVAMAERLCNMSCGELVELVAALDDRQDGAVVVAALRTALATHAQLFLEDGP